MRRSSSGHSTMCGFGDPRQGSSFSSSSFMVPTTSTEMETSFPFTSLRCIRLSCTFSLPSLVAAVEMILDCRAVSLTSKFRYHLSPSCSTMRTWYLCVSLSSAILSGSTLRRNPSTASQSLVPI
ncbi:MAG: hypothetical protein ACK56I_10045, partial [bacterium]